MLRRVSFCKLVLVMVLLLWVSVVAVCEEETCATCQTSTSGTLTGKLDVAYVSKHIWRGLALNPDPALQPSLTISHPSGVSFNWWGSLDTTDVKGQNGNFTEIDYTLNYAWSVGKLGMNAGIIDYTFPNTPAATTAEAYVSTCFGGLLSPTVGINYDFAEGDGIWASLGIGYTCSVPWKKTVTSLGVTGRVGYATSGWNKFNFGVDESGFTDFLVGASMPLPVSSMWTITPSLNYSTVIDSALREAVTKPDNFWAGVTFSVAF